VPLWLLGSVALGFPLLQPSQSTAITMKIRRVFAGLVSEQTIYIQGDRKRMEFRNYIGQQRAYGFQQWLAGPRLAAITRCDLRQFFELNLDTAEYVSAPYPPHSESAVRGTTKPFFSLREKPTVRIETSTVDTGERKEFFGHLARHVITTRKQIPLEGSQSQAQETLIDGWYIDLDTQISCDRHRTRGKQFHGLLVVGMQAAENREFVEIGEPELGFPMQLATVSKGTYTLSDGISGHTDSMSKMLVTELQLGPVDPRLFEIPPRFKHVQHIERHVSRSAFIKQAMEFWEHFRTKVAGFFNL
jgi:hypothetical protein